MSNWFITGISSGLGRALAETLLARGDRVFGTVRAIERVADLRAHYPDRLHLATLDLRATEAVRAVVDDAFAVLGSIDAVVNNAGYGLFGAAESLTLEQIKDQVATNLLAPIEVARAALPHLRQQGSGRLIAISSYGGQATHGGASLYHASKWGLEGFFDALAQEVAPFGIGVTIVEPGAARTGFRAAASAALGVDLDAYRQTPIGQLRDILKDPARTPGGDPQRMATAIIESASDETAPLRLVLGSDAQSILDRALSARLEQVRAQVETASRTDAVAA